MPTTKELRASAEAALTELGYHPPTARPDDVGATVHPQRTHSIASGQGLLSMAEVEEVAQQSLAVTETLERRKAALRLAGESPDAAEALATADTFPRDLVRRVHDATRTLRVRLTRELAEAEAFAKGGSPTDSLAGIAERRVAAARERLATLDTLSRTVEYVPSSMAARLAEVEALAAEPAA